MIFIRRLLFSIIIIILISEHIFSMEYEIEYCFGYPYDEYSEFLNGITISDNIIYNSSSVKNSEFSGYIKCYDFEGNNIYNINTGLPEIRALEKENNFLWLTYIDEDLNSRILKMNSDFQIINEYLIENFIIQGLSYYDSKLFYTVIYPDNNAGIYFLDTVSGESSFFLETEGTQPTGLEVTDDYIFYAMHCNDGDSEAVYCYNKENQEIETVIPITEPIYANPYCLEYYNDSLWLIAEYSNPGNKALFKISLFQEPEPLIELSTDNVNFNSVNLGENKTVNIKIFNLGTGDLIIESISNSNPEVFSFSLNDYIIEYSDSALFSLSFSPIEFGEYTGFINIYSNSSVNSEIQIDLNGFGIFSGPKIEIPDSLIDFGNTNLYTDKSVSIEKLTISNLGSEELIIEDIEFQNSSFNLCSWETIPLIIDPLNSDIIHLEFNPNLAGYISSEIIIHSNDTLNPCYSITLSGSADSSDFSFGDIIWKYEAPDNSYCGGSKSVLSILENDDLNGDNIPEIISVSNNNIISCINGNSTETGDIIWSFNLNAYFDFSYIHLGNDDFISSSSIINKISDTNNNSFSDFIFYYNGSSNGIIILDGLNGECINQREIEYSGDVSSITSSNYINSEIFTAFNMQNGSRIIRFDINSLGIIQERFLNFEVYNLKLSPDNIYLTAAGNKKIIKLHTENLNTAWEYSSPDNEIFYKIQFYNNNGFNGLLAGSKNEGLSIGRVLQLNNYNGMPVWGYDFNRTVNHINICEDLNSDNYFDLVISLRESAVPGDTEKLYLLSGFTGESIYERNVQSTVWNTFSFRDINNDGFKEIVSSFSDGSIKIISPIGLEILDNIFLNDSGTVLSAPFTDIDSNSISEIIAGDNSGYTMILSGGREINTSINNTEYKLDFFLAPNPVNNTSSIHIHSNREIGSANFKLYNVLGRNIFHINKNFSNIKECSLEIKEIFPEINELCSGVYFLEFVHYSKKEIRKFVIMK